MDKEKSIDVIELNYREGLRKGKMFNFVITIIVPFCMLIIIFAGIIGMSNQYVSAKRELLSEIEVKKEEVATKEEILENQREEIKKLMDDMKVYENEISTLELKLDKRETDYKKLLNRFKSLEKDYNKLKKLAGFRTYVSYNPKHSKTPTPE